MDIFKALWDFFNPPPKPQPQKSKSKTSAKVNQRTTKKAGGTRKPKSIKNQTAKKTIREISETKLTQIHPEPKQAQPSLKQKPEVPLNTGKPEKKQSEPEAIGIRRTYEKITIQVGIDFGTSSTKVAYKELGEMKEVVPICFDHQSDSYPAYCMPSVAAYKLNKNNKWELLLGVEAAKYLENRSWDDGLRRFKLLVAGHYDKSYREKDTHEIYFEYLEATEQTAEELHPVYLTITYLVYIMQLTRKTIQNKYPNNELNLAFNVGMPVDHLENSKVFEVFQRIIATAEILENNDGTPDRIFKEARNLFQTVQYDKSSANIFAIAEAVAVIASYVTTTRVKDGIHVLVDFGSGTTDVSIFNIRRKTSEVVWYAARHIPCGMHKIDQIITKAIKEHMSEKELTSEIKQLRQQSDLQAKVRFAIESLWEKTHDVWNLAYIKNNRKQGNWDADKVQIYTCGGGSLMPFIDEIFKHYSLMGRTFDGFEYPISNIPLPENYLQNNNVPFLRICLAYGLTIPEPSLGKYILPAEAPDDTPPRKTVFTHDNEYHLQNAG